jgi:hypothetical protein
MSPWYFGARSSLSNRSKRLQEEKVNFNPNKNKET